VNSHDNSDQCYLSSQQELAQLEASVGVRYTEQEIAKGRAIGETIDRRNR